jgi:DNA damage-inducible protein 1
MTIMSSACAERCGIMRLVDTRWAGIAKGVGTQKIVGRVHLGNYIYSFLFLYLKIKNRMSIKLKQLAQIQIEKNFLTTAFSILEEQPMDMLLGLDLLRRHQCIIDLQQNILIFKSANIQTRFLTEGELPSFARLNHTGEDNIAMEPEPSTSSSSKQTNENNSKD